MTPDSLDPAVARSLSEVNADIRLLVDGARFEGRCGLGGRYVALLEEWDRARRRDEIQAAA